METRVIYIRKPQLTKSNIYTETTAKNIEMKLTHETRAGHPFEEPSIGVTTQDQRGIPHCLTNGVY